MSSDFVRLAVLVTGPNGSGKTTAVSQAASPWASALDPRLHVIFGDHRYDFGGPVAEVRRAVIKALNFPAEVVLIESTDRVARALAAVGEEPAEPDGIQRDLVAFVTTTEPAAMRMRLQRRCAERGKRYRDEYWDEKRLAYEGQRRYPNMMRDKFPGVPVTYWPIGPNYEGAEALIAALRALLVEHLGEPQLLAEAPAWELRS